MGSMLKDLTKMHCYCLSLIWHGLSTDRLKDISNNQKSKLGISKQLKETDTLFQISVNTTRQRRLVQHLGETLLLQ